MSTLVKIWILFTMALSTVGCVESKNATDIKRPSEMVSIDLPLSKVDESSLNTEQISLLRSLKLSKTVHYRMLMDQVLLSHAEAYGDLTVVDQFDRFENETAPPASPLQSKPKYEEKIEAQNQKPIIYNIDANTIGHLLNDSKMQCFSGTDFYMLHLSRKLAGSEIVKENMVVILENGHILPGQMILVNDKWRLYGIETTKSGEAIIDKGWAAQLHLKGKLSRVVSAELYYAVQVFKDHFASPADLDAAVNSAIDQTAKKYGITPLPITNVSTASAGQNPESLFNSTPFGFGKPNTPPGDIVRTDLPGIEDGVPYTTFLREKSKLSDSVPQEGNVILGPQDIEEMQIEMALEKITEAGIYVGTGFDNPRQELVFTCLKDTPSPVYQVVSVNRSPQVQRLDRHQPIYDLEAEYQSFNRLEGPPQIIRSLIYEYLMINHKLIDFDKAEEFLVSKIIGTCQLASGR
ncbi:MAG: hypothetical protein R2827_01960 [Bdellovibrionales bacterium]